MICELMEQREQYLSSLKYCRVVTEEDDSQSEPEDELWSTYCDEDDFQPYPNYQTEWCPGDWFPRPIFLVGHGTCPRDL